MDAKELATLLNGRLYRAEITKDEERQAAKDGLVAVFGASDDLMEFRGAISDELGAWEGTTAYLTSDGLLQNDCANDECPHFENLKEKAATIYAGWNEEGYSWIYATDIPHEQFTITDDGEPYCRGIVFHLKDVVTK